MNLSKRTTKLLMGVISTGFAFAISNISPIVVFASTDLEGKNYGITEDGFSYVIENGEVTLTNYSLNPKNELFYGYGTEYAEDATVHYYGLSSVKATYDEAKELCEKSGGHLVTIDSFKEREVIFELESIIDSPLIIESSTNPFYYENDFDFEEFPIRESAVNLIYQTREIENSPFYREPGFREEGYEEDRNKYMYTYNDVETYFICEWENTAPQNYYKINRNIVIPENIGDYPITKLADNLFPLNEKYNMRDYIYTLKINAQVEKLCNLSSAPFLTKVELPDSLKEIKDCQFFNCISLWDITIPQNVERIGDYAFAATGTSDLYIPGNVKSIGNFAFADSLVNSVTMEEGISSIGDYAFNYAINMDYLIVPKTVTSLGYSAISNTYIRTLVTPVNQNSEPEKEHIPQLVDSHYLFGGEYRESRYYGNGMIYYTKGLYNLVYPYGTKNIYSKANSMHTYFTVIIPESVTYIEKGTFSNCSIIKKIYLPNKYKGMTYDEIKTLLGCDNIENIIFGANHEEQAKAIVMESHDEYLYEKVFELLKPYDIEEEITNTEEDNEKEEVINTEEELTNDEEPINEDDSSDVEETTNVVEEKEQESCITNEINENVCSKICNKKEKLAKNTNKYSACITKCIISLLKCLFKM
ncbi:MAG: leucine-rich repeat protein [Lachnospiraceae bacterium]|nr:leucine-rich repeat protein [Lachnospiraceae bacterium]